jgi:hypothetical protein
LRFSLKRNMAIKKWHSRARLIDIRKTKVILLEQFELPRAEKTEKGPMREDEAIAIPVTVLDETGDNTESPRESLGCLQEIAEEIIATPVEVFPQ